MATLIKVKKDMEFYKSLSSLLRVLKGIAVSQYQILERKIKSFDKFSSTVGGFLEGIDISSLSHPFVNSRTTVKVLVAITSDSGLLGGLNTKVMKGAFGEMSDPKDILMVVGERGKMYANEQGYHYIGFPGIAEEERLELAFTIRDNILAKVLEGEAGQVVVIYPRALSLTVQRIEAFSPIPYGASKEAQGKKLDLDGFIRESSLENIVEYLLYLWLGRKLYEMLGQAKLAELGARFMHLEESSQRLGELDKNLKLKYFRLKHELTDASMREIFASRLIHTGK